MAIKLKNITTKTNSLVLIIGLGLSDVLDSIPHCPKVILPKPVLLEILTHSPTFTHSLMVCMWSVALWTQVSGYGTWRRASVVTPSWATRASHQAWSSRTTSSSLATLTPQSRSGTLLPAGVCRLSQVSGLVFLLMDDVKGTQGGYW